MNTLQIITTVWVISAFILIPIFYSKEEKVDWLSFSIFVLIVSCILTAFAFYVTEEQFLSFVEFQPLIYILAMNIIVIMLDNQGLFQVLAIKGIQLTKSNPRRFLYLMSFLSIVISSIMEDVSVILLFIPLVIRTCLIMKIKPHPFIYCIAVCVNMGNLLTPFSNSQNIIITNIFHLSTAWFFRSFLPAVLLFGLFTIFIFDRIWVRNQPPPTEDQKRLLMEIIQPRTLIKNAPKFWLNCIVFIAIIICIIAFPSPYLVASIGAIFLLVLNKERMGKNLEKLDWKIIFFLISLFLITGCMIANGTIEYLGSLLTRIMTGTPLWDAIIILIAVSLISSFISNNPATLLFIPLISTIIMTFPSLAAQPDLLFIAFIIGLNLGGNLLPEGAPGYLVTINLAQKYKIEGFDFNSMRKMGMKFSLLHMALGILYLMVFSLFL